MLTGVDVYIWISKKEIQKLNHEKCLVEIVFNLKFRDYNFVKNLS